MQELRVDTAGLPAMAGRWAATAGELTATAAPVGLGLPCQPSAAAVNAAHVDIAVFTASLAARVDTHSIHVGEANGGYLTNEAEAANETEAVPPRVIGV
ncbi:hypothetical protein [Mycobacterium colombiense]|uniref:hypothetical protein n=1 Tax=Mycobacterium colombiense TaxID=339268 RepID=UPI0007ED6FA5|nr:hypothetical protein [Mycobacterium colombiense]OBJ33739.1 hypothetical protein A5620_23375 [Mycobacterium colombiense]